MKKSCLLMILFFSVIFAFAASDKPTGAVGRWGVVIEALEQVAGNSKTQSCAVDAETLKNTLKEAFPRESFECEDVDEGVFCRSQFTKVTYTAQKVVGVLSVLKDKESNSAKRFAVVPGGCLINGMPCYAVPPALVKIEKMYPITSSEYENAVKDLLGNIRQGMLRDGGSLTFSFRDEQGRDFIIVQQRGMITQKQPERYRSIEIELDTGDVVFSSDGQFLTERAYR
jgi:hypothetical protein